MDVEQILMTVAGCPVVISDQSRRIIAMNDAAEELLGYEHGAVDGKRCYDVVCGKDLFGNDFCHEHCTVGVMAQSRQPIRHFEMQIATASKEKINVGSTVLVLRDDPSDQMYLVHIMNPLPCESEAASQYSPVPLHTKGNGEGNRPTPLTLRETEVLQHLSQGRNCRNIAGTLFISVPTARNHVQNILRKLDVHSQLEAVATAHREGLL